ncbi:hypothetical protein [Teredinibacter franksiae]|uniref:hypothetical protein n=1 Tax=Teredinibacter franksiae TaxID=2761453 RepID=UPI0016239D7D|nr:hypothetical protein [Teredinibacter franksiae]
MKEKELKSAAKSLADMAASSSIELNQLLEDEKGTITFSLLNVKGDEVVGAKLRSWWSTSMSKYRGSDIKEIDVELKYDSSSVKTNRDKTALFKLNTKCIITTVKNTFIAESENSVWWQKNA